MGVTDHVTWKSAMSAPKISFHPGTVIIKDKGSAKEGEKNKDKSQTGQ